MANEKKSNKNIITTIVVALIVGVAGFFGGIKYQQLQPRNTVYGQFAGARFGQGNNGTSGATGRRGGFGGAVIGEVLSQDANSLTVKLADGSSKIVNLSSTTTYSKSAAGSVSDLTTGTRVAVFGTSNSDGSVTAQNVSINPITRTGQGGQGNSAPKTTPTNY